MFKTSIEMVLIINNYHVGFHCIFEIGSPFYSKKPSEGHFSV